MPNNPKSRITFTPLDFFVTVRGRKNNQLTLNRASAGIYARTVLYCTVLHCTVLYITVQSLTFPQIPCVRLCENLRVLGLV